MVIYEYLKKFEFSLSSYVQMHRFTNLYNVVLFQMTVYNSVHRISLS